MDSDELKALWQKQDGRLEEHLKLNEQILLQMKLNRVDNEFRKLMNFEIFSVIGSLILITVLAYLTFRYPWLSLYALLGYAAIGIVLMSLIFSMSVLTGFGKLRGYDESVVKVQKELAFQKKRLLLYRKIEIATVPILFAIILPLIFNTLYHADLFGYWKEYIIWAAIGCAVTISVGIWSNRIFYDKRIASAEALLKSIVEFEEDK